MPHTRRSFALQLSKLAAALPLALQAAASAARAEEAAAPAGAMNLTTMLRQALPPTADPATRAATEGTLARLSGLDLDPSQGRLVLVNIAAAELQALESGREVLRSRVIVGAARTPTPRLSSLVPSVRLNPPWYVPASIEPEVVAAGAAGFLRFNGRLVQPPGPRNPLGRIRVGLEASQGIYLHGTSDPRLFARAARALSHGCVRVERIVELAAWILGRSAEEVQAAIATGRTQELTPPDSVRVALLYLTAWPGGNGQLVVHADPYGLDRSRRQTRRASPPSPDRREVATAQVAGG